jgi:two-component system response regulator HydG
MPLGGGMKVVNSSKNISPTLPVIMITAYPTVDSAVEAFKSGITDYLVKPFTIDQLISSVENVLKISRARDRADLLETLSKKETENDEILGSSEVMKSLLISIRRIAPLESNVLILGETGTGKELIAKAVHRLSKRASSPFVVINCAAIPESLFESELLGFEKGAFTGAFTAKEGLIEQAHNGTLFLDEIGDLPLASQAKLLRCLEEKTVRRIGGQKNIPVDVRIIAATNKNLKQEVQNRRFREDLFYRVSVLDIEAPPLRLHPQDIPQLAIHYLKTLSAEKWNKVIHGISEEAVEILLSHHWPGNVRELINSIQKAAAFTKGPLITADDLLNSGAIPSQEERDKSPLEPRQRVMKEFERNYIVNVLKKNDWNISRSSKAIGIHRTTLQRLIKRYSIQTGNKA